MHSPRLLLGWLAAATSAPALAATGLCDSNPPTTTDACINAIQSSGGVVNDIFRDKNGRTGSQLPAFGTLVTAFPGCGLANCAGCNPGQSNPPYDCPGQYTCSSATPCTLTSVSAAVNSLDRLWGHPCRLGEHALVNGCPPYSACIDNGDGGAYFPWEGLIFDLGGPSNQVAIFAENDHGPQPCESAEYTIFLTDDISSRDLILRPTTSGADPSKWNRAVLKTIFTKGFVEVRPPDPTGHASCGDTPQYSVEEDSMVTVYGLPCGINFRYAAVVAGNDGFDFPECDYQSNEAELDAVAGLTEEGAGVCPDVDRDGYATCACPGAPALCDCSDADPTVHPNAPEACDSAVDSNCNGVHPEPCAAGTRCHRGLCLPVCPPGELTDCPTGSACQPIDAGVAVCVPADCVSGGCPPGAVCDTASRTCRAACDSSVVCPVGQRCVSGECVDLCRGVTCSAGWSCADGVCTPPCSCFSGDVGCDGGLRCDRGGDGGAGSNQCVTSACLGVTCAPGLHCGPAGTCVDVCSGVACPPGRVCQLPGDAGPGGCVNLCANVHCGAAQRCESATGRCVAVEVDAGADGGADGGLDAGLPDAGGATDGGGADAGGGGSIHGSGRGCGCDGATGAMGLALLALARLGTARRRPSRRARARPLT